MSIINKMLQDLDRRQGASDPEGTLVQQVRSVPSVRSDREWFWRIMAVLLIAALAWVAWLVWQLQPREPIATPLALKAAQNATRPLSPAAVPAEPKPVAQVPLVQKPVAEPKPAAEVAAVVDAKPVAEAKPPTESPAAKAPTRTTPEKKAPARVAPPVAAAATVPVPVEKAVASTPPAKMLGLDVPPARILQAPSQGAARVEKRDRARSVEDRAESEFRRGAVLLNEGRVAEAEELFAAALGIAPTHEAARQALVALHLEQGRIDDARRLLQEGVALNPANTRFVSVLARVHIERRDFPAALAVLNAVKAPEQAAAEFQTMRGTVLQQLGRHAEAVEAFQGALRGAPQNGAVWMGLAISLDSAGKKTEAAEAFRSAAATGTLSTETRAYAEQRARQLR